MQTAAGQNQQPETVAEEMNNSVSVMGGAVMEGLPEGSGEGSPARPRRVRSDGGRADRAGYAGSCVGNKAFASREIFADEEGLEVPFLLPRPRLSARLSHFCIPILFCLLVCKHTHAYLTCIFFCVRFCSFIRTYTLINTYIDAYLHRHVYAYTHTYIL